MTACARPGCGGTLEDDGFCDTCGLEAVVEAASSRTSASTSTATAAWTPSTSTLSTSSAGTTSSRRGSSRTASRGLLGAGLVQVPPVPARDPATAVLADPRVPENKRYCSKCGTKVGRGKDGNPGREDGYCQKCGNHFSFTPKLTRGELVHGQYEVLGCLAHGGLGWIYLARDRAVGDRWVALKGLLDSGDADAFAAAKAERQFLADVEHPSIVKIYNFVEHSHPGDEGSVGYIVMEYVGGTSVKDLIKRHREEVDPAGCLPPEQAIAYALDMLPVLGFLHGIGLLFCDFKPDNMIQSEEQLKLIDLGAVRHADDHRTAIYGTIGYQAPEIGDAWPTVASDLYTVGRSLAVMSFPFDFQVAYRHSLPGPAQVPMLADYDSYHRFLLRATAKEPQRRFPDAEQMRDQLTGVLREILATQDGQPRSGTSKEFTPERRTFGLPSGSRARRPEPTEIATVLPVPLADAEDPGIVFLADVTTTDPKELIAELSNAEVGGAEVRLRLARAHLDLGQTAEAGKALDKLAKTLVKTGDPDDWRLDWYRGLIALYDRKPKDAQRHFSAVYDTLPGEAAPKLALAAAAEMLADLKTAERYYRVVWRTDRTYVSAAFGLARVLLGTGDRAEAVDVLNSVPFTSNHHLVAQLTAIRARTAAATPADLTETELVAAGKQLADLTELDAERQALVTRDLLEAALGWVRANANGTAKGHVLGHRLAELDLRTGLEGCYRTLARQAGSKADRIALVDLANTIRPRTWT